MTVDVEQIVKSNSGIRLDIGGGGNPQPGFVNMDARALPGVDIVWDVLKFPWPLPDESVVLAMASHLLEHIPPFQTDPKLLGLIELLLDTGVVTPEQIRKFVGRYDSQPFFIAFMNEVWRVMKVGGRFAIVVPHGRSQGFLQDPSHCNAMNETRWSYFDPFEPRAGFLWHIYKPLPWMVEPGFFRWSPDANMEVVLVKRDLAEVTDVG
jgi:hypothetical protein